MWWFLDLKNFGMPVLMFHSGNRRNKLDSDCQRGNEESGFYITKASNKLLLAIREQLDTATDMQKRLSFQSFFFFFPFVI